MQIITCIGWVNKNDVNIEIMNELSHFWTRSSPNSMPFTTMKNIDTVEIKNERM